MATAIATCALLLLVPALINQSHAYGKDAVWQVELSENFNDPGSGQNGGGGFWGWLELDNATGGSTRGESADAILTGCGHAGLGTGLAGATHYNMDIDGWNVAPSSEGPHDSFWAGERTMTIPGTFENGTKLMRPVTITLAQAVDQGLFTYDRGAPAAAGHYNATSRFGVQILGIAVQIQVVQLSHQEITTTDGRTAHPFDFFTELKPICLCYLPY